MIKSNLFWEVIGYLTLVLCLFGQVAVGNFYIVAQLAYLIANLASCIRDIALKLPIANLVKDICFTIITIILLVIQIFIKN